MADEIIDVDGYDPENPKPLLPVRAQQPKNLDVEEDVEYTSLPQVDDLDGFKRSLCTDKTIILDPDIYEWLVSRGLDYQSRANAILRRAMILEGGLMPSPDSDEK